MKRPPEDLMAALRAILGLYPDQLTIDQVHSQGVALMPDESWRLTWPIEQAGSWLFLRFHGDDGMWMITKGLKEPIYWYDEPIYA